MPSFGSARSSQFPPHQISPPPSPEPLRVAQRLGRSFLSYPFRRSPSPAFRSQHPLRPPSRPRSHYPPPALPAPSRNLPRLFLESQIHRRCPEDQTTCASTHDAS